MTQSSIAREIVDHYSSYDESKRLTGGFGLLERQRTMELIARYLPPPPATVVDVGGASGVYSFWLAGLGHRVHLVDIVPKHIEQARERASTPGSASLASIKVGDARAMDYPDDYADVILSHGPLYHLVDREARLRTLSEAKRVLRPGGILLAFAITRYAGVIYGLTRGHVFDDEYWAMTEAEVTSGLRTDAPGWLNTFPSAFFHHPDDLAGELAEAGLIHERTLGVIGPAWLVPDLDEHWGDEDKRQRILDVARLLKGECALGPRLMAVARKADTA